MRPVNIRSIPFCGYSMYPALRPGDTLIVKKVNGKGGDIKLGDIVCFSQEESYTAHRVINIIENEKDLTVTTKGDNMTSPDTPRILNGDGILKVVMIKRGGSDLIKPGFGRIHACLSSSNLTFGIVKGWIGRGLKRFIIR
ncbi:MAG: signal peptidase I [Deltaproteobacteria bacterium]|uniref:Signal peptidase I n=1 Tax=Candidatus Zymogenus saltonus TaxID=2844893 RepID=A0A9D8PP70_9DELT|nr:signal peptidase I [Candidatus Zymogenus saltonus]